MTEKFKELSFYAKVISNYRITIPETIRESLGITEGDLVRVEIYKATSGADDPAPPTY